MRAFFLTLTCSLAVIAVAWRPLLAYSRVILAFFLSSLVASLAAITALIILVVSTNLQESIVRFLYFLLFLSTV